jgi:hypothetical protein
MHAYGGRKGEQFAANNFPSCFNTNLDYPAVQHRRTFSPITGIFASSEVHTLPSNFSLFDRGLHACQFETHGNDIGGMGGEDEVGEFVKE